MAVSDFQMLYIMRMNFDVICVVTKIMIWTAVKTLNHRGLME